MFPISRGDYGGHTWSNFLENKPKKKRKIILKTYIIYKTDQKIYVIWDILLSLVKGTYCVRLKKIHPDTWTTCKLLRDSPVIESGTFSL